MTPEAALARLRLWVQPEAEPTLTEAQLTDLLAANSLEDSEGVAPGDTGWVGTYDLRRAAHDGWQLKAQLVAADVNYRADDASFNQSEVYQHCLTMADRFRRKAGSITLGAS